MKSLLIINLALVLFSCFVTVQAQNPVMYWDFEKNENRTTIEVISGIADTLEGNFEKAKGINGTGIRLDGYTTCIRKSPENITTPGDEFTIEAWVALGNYPWNWCPILTTESADVSGYHLMLGPLGQVSLQGAINEQWVSCSSAQEIMPLRKWMYIVGVYRANQEMTLFLNGKKIASCPIQSKIHYSLKLINPSAHGAKIAQRFIGKI